MSLPLCTNISLQLSTFYILLAVSQMPQFFAKQTDSQPAIKLNFENEYSSLLRLVKSATYTR